MRIIQTFLPHPRHTEVHRISVNAAPEIAWQEARHYDMAEVPWIKLLFDIRTMPKKLLGGQETRTTSLGVDEITREGSGFRVLKEIPGREVVVGAIGQFWHLNIPFKTVDPANFRDFHEHNFGKVAWSIRVEPFHNGSTICLELRTTATDEKSWTRLNKYYKVIGIGSQLIRKTVMSHFEYEFGKMKLPDDDVRPLAGDDLITHGKYGLTFSRDIEAPASIVWRYLMQLGCDRAGWYSIDALDHGGIPSVDHLVEGWESRAVGDTLSATPNGDSFFNVHACEKEKHFVIGGEGERLGSPFKMTWAFVIEPIGEDACHLISRVRMVTAPKWKEWLTGKVAYPPVHGLMSHVQLDTIRDFAERDAQTREPGLA